MPYEVAMLAYIIQDNDVANRKAGIETSRSIRYWGSKSLDSSGNG